MMLYVSMNVAFISRRLMGRNKGVTAFPAISSAFPGGCRPPNPPLLHGGGAYQAYRPPGPP
eukprot:12824401-Alexandrium_andersonii.AAC.1